MSVAVDVSADGVRAPLAAGRVRAVARAVLHAERVRDALVSIAFVSRAAIARLNRRHLGRRGDTDVIAFGLRAAGPRRGAVIGDIYIAPDVVRANARRLGEPVRRELTRVVIHGVLHSLGHDHPDDGARTRSAMWRRQERLLARLAGPAGAGA